MSHREISEDHDLDRQDYVDFLRSIEEGDEDRARVRGFTPHENKLHEEEEQE